jgi:ABC-type branched-subunit amino acid transport system substrate-binding protein/Flp pilus assembly protein TadD
MVKKRKHVVKIFCSYAHKDQKLRDELEKHLVRRDVWVWHDRDISVGTNWVTEIDANLESSDIVLLLISPDFMASRYCYEKEMMRALDRQKEESIFVIPVIMRPTFYGLDCPFSSLQASPHSPDAPYPLKPVSTWEHQDEAFVEIAKDIDKDIRKVLKKKYMQDGDTFIANAQQEEGYQAYREAFNQDPRDVELCEKLAVLLISLECHQEALGMYKNAIELQHDNGHFFRKKGELQKLLGQYKEASIAYQQAIKLGEDDATLYEEMGDVFSILQHFHEAEEAYSKAIRLRPYNDQLYRKLGTVLNGLGKKQEGLKAYALAEHTRSDKLQVYADKPETVKMLNNQKRNEIRKSILLVISWIIIFVVVLYAISPHLFGRGRHTTQTITGVPNGLGEFNASNGELLGVNDGSYAPFLTQGDGQLKKQAADQLKQGHSSEAISLWQEAIHSKNNDAEACIYSENQLVLLSGLPYITLVVGADLFEAQSSGLSALQGAYVAQHEFNNGNHGFRLRLFIANSGTDTNNVPVITQMIVNIAKKDKTVVGVVSWLTSIENVSALKNLSPAHIPIVSPEAGSDQLTNISPYFLRIIAPTKVQGKQSALFAEKNLHAKRAVIFADDKDSYSQNAAQVFETQFGQDGNTILKVEPFTTGKMSDIKSLIQDALAMKPDLLFFTSRDVDDDAIFQDALPTSGLFANLPVLTGGAGYVAHKAGYGRWYINADAYPDELKHIAGNALPQSPFYQDYSNAFNKDDREPAGYYGYTLPDSYAMLSYDVTDVLLNAVQMVITNNKITLTVDGLEHITPTILAHTLPYVIWQGVSGRIAFDTVGNPIKKVIIFLGLSSVGRFYVKDWLGCFTQTLCRNAI